MTDYPVQLDVTSPAHFARVQLLLRIAFAIVAGWLGVTGGWVACVLFAVLPLVAAIAMSSYGREKYLTDSAPKIWSVLNWLIELSAFMLLLTDRFPVRHEEDALHSEIRFTGKPTIGSALIRLLTSIPSAIVLFFISIVSGFVWLIGAFLILVGAPMPHWVTAYQLGVLRWQARLIAYHASLVEEYPPFALDTETGSRAGGTLAAHAP
ncbi:MAG TPA: DUF4389 domain-containing protein [Kofleriaceae bacterium]|nr:DUF4389 domain-containing protein [Kofleriaceae bacterium]